MWVYDKFRGLREIGWCAGNALYRIAEAEGGYFGFQIPDSRNLEFIKLDWINHMPGWQIRPPDDANRIVRERIESSPDGWIFDHHTPYLCQLICQKSNR